MERVRGILAAMAYLGKRPGWRFEIDVEGARLKQMVCLQQDQSHSIDVEDTMAELQWGKGFKDMQRDNVRF